MDVNESSPALFDIKVGVELYNMSHDILVQNGPIALHMEDFDMFTLDDVDAAFDKVVQLKHNQKDLKL